MKKYIVFKFRDKDVFVYIVEAENAEYAMTLFFGVSKCVGKFRADNFHGEGGFAIELEGEEYAVSEYIQPIKWVTNALQVMQNNN